MPGFPNVDNLVDNVDNLLYCLFRHLLNSPEVYLCELSTRKFTPVLLTDMQYDRKTFKGNGRQVNMYSFNAALAQQRFRR